MPLAALAGVNSASRREPSTASFQGARTIYAFESGALYRVYTNPAFVTAILLEPGETLNDIAAGDTSRWMVTQAQGGADGAPRSIILIKPQARDLQTNIVLVTDRRTYLLEAMSLTGGVYAPEIAWSYPSSAQPSVSPSPQAINFNYRIRTIRGRKPVWTPQRVYDDGRRTWIEFPPEAAASDLPPFFVIGAEGDELVNYRVQAGRYMVDRIFDVGELRLGAAAQTIVRIERDAAALRDRPGPHP